jgi:hypothetical protein
MQSFILSKNYTSTHLHSSVFVMHKEKSGKTEQTIRVGRGHGKKNFCFVLWRYYRSYTQHVLFWPFKKLKHHQVPVAYPIILVTREAEIRKIRV